MRAIAALLLFSSLAVGQYQLPPPVYDYVGGSRQAIERKTALVVFVGHRPTHDLYNCATATATFLDGYPAQCVVVAYPKDGTVYWQATLPMGATPQKIAEHVGYAGLAMRKAVTVPTVDPFRFVQQPRSSTYCST